MKLKGILRTAFTIIGILTAVLAFTACSNHAKDPKDNTYATAAEAIDAVTTQTQNFVTQIEAREGQTVVVWQNTSKDAESPFTLGLVEKDGDTWKVTDTRNAEMKGKAEGSGVYPAQDGLITYAISLNEDDPIAENFGEHMEVGDWWLHWTIVPALPA